MNISNQCLWDGHHLVAELHKYGVIYNCKFRIYAPYKHRALSMCLTDITDTEILEHYDDFIELANAIKEENIARANKTLEFLCELRNLLDRKIEYALSQDYNHSYFSREKMASMRVDLEVIILSMKLNTLMEDECSLSMV